jgi:hypothetical protein
MGEGRMAESEPESCLVSRKAAIEALTGASAGRVLSCEIIAIGVLWSAPGGDESKPPRKNNLVARNDDDLAPVSELCPHGSLLKTLVLCKSEKQVP